MKYCATTSLPGREKFSANVGMSAAEVVDVEHEVAAGSAASSRQIAQPTPG